MINPRHDKNPRACATSVKEDLTHVSCFCLIWRRGHYGQMMSSRTYFLDRHAKKKKAKPYVHGLQLSDKALRSCVPCLLGREGACMRLQFS